MNRKELEQHVARRPAVTSDQYVCGQVVNEYKNLQIEGRRVLDLGANIGAFSVYAALRGAKSITAIEPDPENHDLCRQNIRPFLDRTTLLWGAVTRKDDQDVPFYLTTGLARDGFSTVPFRGRTEISVPNCPFNLVLAIYPSEVIKMDVEGEEHNLLFEPLPDCVKELIVEIHFSKKAFRGSLPTIQERFKNWTCVKEPKNTGKNFHTLGHWRR